MTLLVLAAFGVYQRLWTFVGQRDYEAVVKAVFVATLVIVGVIALFHPVQTPAKFFFKHSVLTLESSAVTMPASVIALFVAALAGAAARRALHRPPRGRGTGAQLPFLAKGARDVLIVGGGEGGRLVVRELVRNPQLGLRPVGFVDDDPAQARDQGRVRAARARHHRQRGPRPGAGRRRARRGRDRDSVGARHACARGS